MAAAKISDAEADPWLMSTASGPVHIASVRVFFRHRSFRQPRVAGQRAFADEQSGQLDHLVERAAAVVAQIDEHAVDPFCFEFVEQVRDVARGASIVRQAFLLRLEVGKTRAGDARRNTLPSAVTGMMDFGRPGRQG